MEKGINFATNELKIKLMKDIAEANLPACNTKSILSDIISDVCRMEIQAIERERIEYEKNKENK